MTQASQRVTLFKTNKQFLQFPTSRFGNVAFSNQLFATTDEELEHYIKRYILPDYAMSVYIDEAEPEIDLAVDAHRLRLREADLVLLSQRAMRAAQASSNDKAADLGGVASTKASPTTGGPTGTVRDPETPAHNTATAILQTAASGNSAASIREKLAAASGK